MPNLLANGIATDGAGNQYSYTQNVYPGNAQVVFSKGGQAIDPVSMITLGTNAQTAPVFNYTLTLNKAVNITDSTVNNVVGQTQLNILGQQYIIGSGNDATDLYLYGSGSELTVNEGNTLNFTFSGTQHTVTLTGASSTTQATIVVDGQSKQVIQGSSYAFAGGYNIFIKNIFYTTKTGTLSNIDMLVGSNALHLANNSQVMQGTNGNSIQGTNAVLGISQGDMLNWITVSESAPSATNDYIPIGGSFTDSVFNGAVKLTYADNVPALNSSSNDHLIIAGPDNVNAQLTFPIATGNGTYALSFGHNAQGSANGAISVVRLADTNNATIHVQKGENVFYTGGPSGPNQEYVLVNSGDFGRILKITSMSSTSTGNSVTFQDIVTGQSYQTYNNGTALSLDGQNYYVAENTTGSKQWANITWGPGAASGNPGTVTTLFPRLKMPSGAWFTFLTQTAVTNGTTYSLPGVDSLSTYQSGAVLNLGNSNASTVTNTTTFGNVLYNVTSGNTTNPNGGYNGTINSVTIAGSQCVFNATYGPAILIEQPKTATGSGSTNGDIICASLTQVGSTTVDVGVSTSPVFSDGTSLNGLTLQSNSNRQQAVDVYGSLVQTDAGPTNHQVDIWVPQSQVYADVLLTSPTTTLTSTSGGAVVASSSSSSVKVLGSIAIADSQVAQASNKNLIVVGGSCVNSVAATLLGSSTPLCGADFESATGIQSGQFLIQTFSQSGSTIATLVAGHDAADTTNAVQYLITQPVSTALNSKYVGTSATQATMSTVSSTGSSGTNMTNSSH